MNARFSKCVVSVVLIATLALAIVPLLARRKGRSRKRLALQSLRCFRWRLPLPYRRYAWRWSGRTGTRV